MAEKVPEMLTIREAAKRVGLSYGIIRRWALKGEFATVRSGRRLYVNFDSLVTFLNNGRSEGHA